MIYAKKRKIRTSVKAQQPHYSQRSSSSTRSAMINTQGNTSQGRATSKKNTQERVREVGGKSKKKKNHKTKKTPPNQKKKKNIFSSLLPRPDGWKHLPGFATRGSAACWRALYVPLCGCTIPPRDGLPNGARKMSFG